MKKENTDDASRQEMLPRGMRCCHCSYHSILPGTFITVLPIFYGKPVTNDGFSAMCLEASAQSL